MDGETVSSHSRSSKKQAEVVGQDKPTVKKSSVGEKPHSGSLQPSRSEIRIVRKAKDTSLTAVVAQSMGMGPEHSGVTAWKKREEQETEIRLAAKRTLVEL